MKSIVMIIVAMFAFIGFSFSPGFLNCRIDPDNTVLKIKADSVSTVIKPALTFNPDLPAVDQAKLLLRNISLMGHVSSDLAVIDSAFALRVGKTCEITRDQLRSYLDKNHINEWEIGGNIDMPVSSVSDGNGNISYAKYIVFHDTSFPRYGSAGFPNNINDNSWEWNHLSRWLTNVTHVYVNRIGESKTMTPFSDGMSATKLERYVMGDAASRGLYLHIEMIQPRATMKGYGRHNDVDAPDPGFSGEQYKRLALIYTAAAVRKGSYLIPAFHACVDANIRNAHDDPQNFELPKFFTSVNNLWREIEKK